MLLFARMDRLSHRLGRRSHNSAVAQYQKVIDKHFSKTGDLAWTGTAGGEGEQIATGRIRGELGGGRTSYRQAQRKIGRNDPCGCGSGKKYKHCYGKATL